MKQRPKLNYFLVFVVFLIIFITNACICAFLVTLYLSGALDQLHMASLWVGVLSMIASILISTLVSGIWIKYYFRPLNDLITATKRIASGDFTVQMRDYKISRKYRFPGSGEFAALVNAFNEMVRELRSVEIFRRDFISNFSHEFKTPILSIRGFARQLYHGNLTEEQRREFAKVIWEESDYLSQMSSNILLLTKLEHQLIITDRQIFRLDEQLRDALLLQEASWSEKQLQIECELEPTEVTHNAGLLAHVWQNLISNAIKFTPEGGMIRVFCREEPERVVVIIQDTGCGMSEEVRAHVFEKFYQADSSRQTGGNGLGLPLVQRIIDLSRGEITIESEPGTGTIVAVSIPKE